MFKDQPTERFHNRGGRMTMPLPRIRLAFCLGAMLGGLLAGGRTQTTGPGGGVVTWGTNFDVQMDVPAGLNDVVAVSAGQSHSLGLKSDGSVVAWGSHVYGQTDVPPGLGGVRAIATGGFYNLALKSDGTVVEWPKRDFFPPVPEGLNEVTAIAAGDEHYLVLKSDGTIVTWGRPSRGQTNSPPGLSGVTAIAAGTFHSLALMSDGRVVAWGDISFGQSYVPAGLSGVRAIAAGYGHSLALKSDGSVVAWGDNSSGQTDVPAGLSDVRAIAAGSRHSLALKSDGTVVAWGDNLFGQTEVPRELRTVVALAAGVFHNLAVVLLSPVEVSPTSRRVLEGETVAFQPKVTGTPPLVFQWIFNGTQPIGGPTTSGELVLTNVGLSRAGAYTVVVTNAYGAVTGAPAVLEVIPDPAILLSPTSWKAGVGATVEFAVEATGTPPLACQWFFQATNPISGATGPVLRLAGVQAGQAGAYTVVVTNAAGVATSAPAVLEMLESLVVTQGDETELRTAMAGGGMVKLDFDCTLVLTNTIVVESGPAGLDGTGHEVTLSGGHAVRVLSVSTNVHLTLLHLAIADGTGTQGAGVLNEGGRVDLREVAFFGNHAFLPASSPGSTGTEPGPGGGAIWNRMGTVNALDCTFTGNLASMAPGGLNFPEPTRPACRGGALWNDGGTIQLEDCDFVGNGAVGGGLPDTLAAAPDALGGALDNRGMATVTRCTFRQNSASGDGDRDVSPADLRGHPGAAGLGGAIHNEGLLFVRDSAMIENAARGGRGDDGPYGGEVEFGPIPGMIAGLPGGHGGPGGAGCGGALFNTGTASLVNTTLALNTGLGGRGGDGGQGGREPMAGACRGRGGTRWRRGFERRRYLRHDRRAGNNVLHDRAQPRRRGGRRRRRGRRFEQFWTNWGTGIRRSEGDGGRGPSGCRRMVDQLPAGGQRSRELCRYHPRRRPQSEFGRQLRLCQHREPERHQPETRTGSGQRRADSYHGPAAGQPGPGRRG